MLPVWAGQFHCNQSFMVKNIHSTFLRASGYYTLWLQSGRTRARADGEAPGPRITGVSTFVNRHGYLSAEYYPLMKFFGAMGLVYLGTGLVWLGLMAYYFRDLLPLQFRIAAVIGMGMVEMAISFGDLEYLNNHGERSQFLLVLAKLLFAGKNTFARLLVLVVCMGYGTVKPRLGAAVKQIVALGCSYFFFAAAYGLTHTIGQTEAKESKTELMVVIPLSVLDAAVCWWIFLSLHHTIKILELRCVVFSPFLSHHSRT